MLRFVELASRLVDPAGVQQRFDTVWPPGTAAFIAWTLGLDPTLGVAAWAQVLASCLVPPLVAHTAWLVAGRKAAYVALAMASLHFGFIHYTGFFLAEAMFQVTATVAVWATVSTCHLLDGERARSRWRLVLLGAAAAAPWALATLFRPNALPVALLVGATLAVYWVRRGRRRQLWALLGGASTLALLLAPAAHRCSTLDDLGICPVSSNFAMNVALGQAGEVNLVEFAFTGTPGDYPHWGPPALAHHRSKERVQIPATIYDTRGVLSWVWERVKRQPFRALLRALGNGLDLFRLEYWPDEYGGMNARLAAVTKQLFYLLVLAPGLVGWWWGMRRLRRRRLSSPLMVISASVVAVFGLACISMGEARYRIPFDGLWIVLAGWLVTGARAGPPSWRRAGGAGPTALPAVAVASVAALALLLAMSHPAVAIGHGIGTGTLAGREVVRTKSEEMSKPRGTGTDWDDRTFRFRCAPDCPELRIEWPVLQRGRDVSLSLDHNDGYRVSFYREGAPRGSFDLLGYRHGKGLRVVRHAAPEAAQDGFDSVGVVPLYGDGRYAVGHVVTLPRARRPREK